MFIIYKNNICSVLIFQYLYEEQIPRPLTEINLCLCLWILVIYIKIYSEIKKNMKDFGTSLLLVYASLEYSSFNYKIQETSSLLLKKMRKGIYHQSEQ